MFESFLFVIAFVLMLSATNFLLYFWNTLIASMSQVINTMILLTEPVPDCIQYKKRMVFGSVIQLIFLAVILYINYHKKTELDQLKKFVTVDILLMEGIFMYRLGISFYHFMIGPSTNEQACDITERHIKAFLAPYYILIIARFLIYFLLAKYADLIYSKQTKTQSDNH